MVLGERPDKVLEKWEALNEMKKLEKELEAKLTAKMPKPRKPKPKRKPK